MRTLRKHMTIAIGFVVVAMLSASAASGQEKLDGMVAYSLKKIPPALEKAEKLLQQGDLPNAKVYLEKAQREWDTIHRDFKGKFSEDHARIVEVGQQLRAVKAKVEQAAGAGEGPKAEAAKPAGGKTSPGLPSTMVHEMKAFGPTLDRVEQLVKANELDAARATYDSAKNEWTTKKGWNKGKYDPKHPDVVALDERFAEVGALVGKLAGQATAAAENLPEVLEAVTESSKKLYATYDQARSAIRSLSSLRGDFDRGSESDIGMLKAKMDAVRLLVEEVNEQLPDSLAAARAFRKQYPDFKVLDKLVRKGTRFSGREAGQQVQRLEAFPKAWLEQVRYAAKESLDEAEKNIRLYGTARIKSLKGKDRAVKRSAADSAEHWVLDYSSLLLDMVDTLLPALPAEAQAGLPELVAAREEFSKRAAGMKKSIAKVAKAVSKVRKKMVEADLRRLNEARFPKSKYTGGKWASAEKAIRGAWAKAIKGKKLVKVSIYSPWEVRKEARWVNGRWVINTYRYIGANCLAKLKSGKYRVFRMRFRNTKQADGSWSPLRHRSVGHVYDILKKNINK